MNVSYSVGCPVPEDTAYIKPQVLVDVMMLDVRITCNCHEPTFVLIHILLGIDLAKCGCARLNLHEHNVLLVLSYDVYLDVSQSPVALANLVSMFGQILASSILAHVTYVVM